MPKIFKKNKFALLLANIITTLIWIFLTSSIISLIKSDDLPFYFYKIAQLIKYLPPVWLTYYLWIERRGFK